MEIVNFHIGILIITALLIVYSDHQAFLYITGKKKLLDRKIINIFHYLVWAGLLGMITTGAMMVYPNFLKFLTVDGVPLKMFFVAILIGNSFFIHSLKNIAYERTFESLSRLEKIKLFVSGVLSTIGWIGAATTAIFVLG